MTPSCTRNTERPRRLWAVPPAAFGLCFGAVLALGPNTACAAALGSLTTSVGVLAALAVLFVIKGWPAHLPASLLSTAVGALMLAGGAAWLLWRARAVERVAALAGGLGQGAGRRDARVARPRLAPEVVLPAGLERGVLLADWRQQFVRLQHAWDHAEMPELHALTTPEMLAELCLELQACSGFRANFTEIVTVHAELLGFESLAQVDVASVEFTGLLREAADAGAVPFKELWLLTRSKDESTWRLARHQALV